MLRRVPCDPRRPRAPDPHVAPEARAARELVIERGDGQVSDRPESCPPEELIRVLDRTA